MKSFSAIEKELLPSFREKLNHAEDSVDLSNLFCATAAQILTLALFDEVSPAEIRFTPEKSEPYQLSEKLLKSPLYEDAAATSDLKSILARFAETAAHHHAHLKKHSEKTNKKIKN